MLAIEIGLGLIWTLLALYIYRINTEIIFKSFYNNQYSLFLGNHLVETHVAVGMIAMALTLINPNALYVVWQYYILTGITAIRFIDVDKSLLRRIVIYSVLFCFASLVIGFFYQLNIIMAFSFITVTYLTYQFIFNNAWERNPKQYSTLSITSKTFWKHLVKLS